MHDFGKLVYMDLQKSGSTFVSRFLRETCILPELREWKHGRLNGRPKKGVYYFVTVRHPVAQYSSLFRYGLDGRGGLYERLQKLGKGKLYSGDEGAFNQWLRFVMDYRNAAYLGEGFEKVPESFDLGFLSFRYLMMCLAKPERTLLLKPEVMELSEFVRENSIIDHIIYNEVLNEGLIELSTRIRPEFFDQEKVEKFFREEKRVNESATGAEQLGALDEQVRALLKRKEGLLLSLYS